MESLASESKLTENMTYRVLEKNDKIVKIEFKIDGKVLKIKEYDYVDVEEVYKKIDKKEKIDLNNCYIENFSLFEYRKARGMDNYDEVFLKEFSARRAFFTSPNSIDFCYATFGEGYVDFRGVTFGEGYVDFLGATFGEGNVSFSHVTFGEGNVSFQETTFGKGEVYFASATFGKGKVDFFCTTFGEGNVYFQETTFGEGNVDFSNATFEECDVFFIEATFGEGNVSFSGATFGEGYVSFSDVTFGKGNVEFSGVNFGKEIVDFSSATFGIGDVDFTQATFEGCDVVHFYKTTFGEGDVDFSSVTFGEGEVDFTGVNFGEGSTYFTKVKAKKTRILFRDSILRTYMDLRLLNCKQLEIINCKIEKVIDISWSKECNVDIQTLNLKNTINLGQIKMNWKRNKVGNMIYSNVNNTNYEEKAEQFRLLKENFRSIGQYDDEDTAYVEFKRCELKSELLDSILKPIKVVKKIESQKNVLDECIERIELYADWIAFYLERLWLRIEYFTKWFVFDKIGGFGTKPKSVFYTMIYTILIFSHIYMIPGLIIMRADLSRPISAIYHSIVTFLTIGYGDIQPHNSWGVIISGVEGFIGLFLMSYFTVAFVRKILR